MIAAIVSAQSAQCASAVAQRAEKYARVNVLAEEVRAPRKTTRPSNCAGCGAPQNNTDDQCTYCTG